MTRRQIFSLVLAILLTACTASNSNQQNAPKVTLIVSVAASVQDAMKDVQSIYEEENPNVDIIYNFGSSGSLQRQIEQGAPSDIFISASPKQMNALQKKDILLVETRKNLLENEVVLVTPKDSQKAVSFENLSTANLDRIALGDPKSVPAGEYAKEVLTSLKSYDKLTPKLVFAKDVRQVLFYVETGNVDAGIVYSTDAKVSDKITVTDTAIADFHSPIVYPVAVIKESKNHEEAKKFVVFLLGEKAQKVFEESGFIKSEN